MTRLLALLLAPAVVHGQGSELQVINLSDIDIGLRISDGSRAGKEVLGYPSWLLKDEGKVLMYPRAVFDCAWSDRWTAFRRLLVKHDPVTLAETVREDRELQLLARELVDDYRLKDRHWMGFKFAAFKYKSQMSNYIMDGDRRPGEDDDFCFLGFLSASFVVAAGLQDSQGYRLLREAWWLLWPGGMEMLDWSSSSAWPIGALDIALNVGPGRDTAKLWTVASQLQRQPPLAPEIRPKLWGQPAPELEASAGGRRLAAGNLGRPVTAWVYMDHPGLDLDIGSVLAGLFPGRFQMLLLFRPQLSAYKGGNNTMMHHVCSTMNKFCSPPNAAVSLMKSGFRAEPIPGPLRSPDLLICSWFNFCKQLETLAGKPVPLISLYSGSVYNDFGVRAGEEDAIREHYGDILWYVEREVEGGPAALLLTDSSYHGAIVHAYTGVEPAVYRPLSLYVTATYMPRPLEAATALVPFSRSSSGLAWVFKFHMFKRFAGQFFPLEIVLQEGFMSFDEFATYNAIIYWPAPHTWEVMQFCELYRMGMPIFVPNIQEVLMHTEWHTRLFSGLRHQRHDWWLPPAEHWQKAGHPYSPWWPGNLTYRAQLRWHAASVKGGLYWSQGLRYYAWPHVQIYHGAPHLLHLLLRVDLVGISQEMAKHTYREREEATEFWTAQLPRMLLDEF